MSDKNAKKYGLVMCLCMIIGSVIGTGIFFKNASVYGYVNGNGPLGIIAWILGGIIAISFGMSFMEIASARQDSNSGIALYAKIFINNKIGRVVRNAMANIYIPLTTFTVAYYTAKASIWAIGGGTKAEAAFSSAVGGIAIYELLLSIFALCYTIFVVAIIIYREDFSKWIQIITVFLKMLPLLLLGIIGLFIVNGDAGAFRESGLGNEKYYSNGNKTQFELLLLALPAVLFTFDGFLSVTYIQKDVNNAARNVPLSLVIGLTFITAIYVLVSIGTLNLSATGNVADAAQRVFKNAFANQVFARIVFIFIFISAFGGLNGYSIAMVKLTRSGIDDQFLIGNQWWQKMVKRFDVKSVTLLITFIIIFFWALVMGLPTIISKKQVDFIDFVSNGGVVMAFFFYGLIIFFGIINRFKKKVPVNKTWYFFPAAIIATICISLILSYSVYSYFANIFTTTSDKQIAAILQIIILIIVLVLPWFGILIKDAESHNFKEIKSTTK